MAIRTKGTVSEKTAAAELSSSSGWEDAPTEITDRGVIMAVYGDTGTGRTTFALTAPGPIAFAHAGEKITGIVQTAARQKTVRVLNFGATLYGTPQQIADQAQPIWRKTRDGLMDALTKASWARTGIIDTHNELWELLRLAEFGELNPQGRTDALYGPVNARWRSLFKWHRAQLEPRMKSLIVIGQTREEYKDVTKNGRKESVRTGRTISAGQKEVHYMADVVVRTSRGDNGEFLATIEKAWYKAEYEGVTLANEDATYPKVMSLITETDESEWE